MSAWPKVDPARRAAAFATLRRRQAIAEAHELSPAERFRRAAAISSAWPVDRGSTLVTSDEPPSLWLELRDRLRRVGAAR